MVNFTPAEPRETDAEFRAWLLKRLDFMRSLVESGAPCMIADSDFHSHDQRRVMVAAFHFFGDDWITAHQRRLADETAHPKAS
ncbi:MAG: hypothetical protein M0R73_13375 [Dehalococcoidia bacterium]|nr:hypothetical protein [Dehalococcoidia bacterium]